MDGIHVKRIEYDLFKSCRIPEIDAKGPSRLTSFFEFATLDIVEVSIKTDAPFFKFFKQWDSVLHESKTQPGRNEKYEDQDKRKRKNISFTTHGILFLNLS
jgi:hypothetical protein